MTFSATPRDILLADEDSDDALLPLQLLLLLQQLPISSSSCWSFCKRSGRSLSLWGSLYIAALFYCWMMTVIVRGNSRKRVEGGVGLSSLSATVTSMGDYFPYHPSNQQNNSYNCAAFDFCICFLFSTHYAASIRQRSQEFASLTRSRSELAVC